MHPIEGFVPPATFSKTRLFYNAIKPQRFGLPGVLLFTLILGFYCQPLPAQDIASTAQIFNRARYLPTPGMEATMVGGKFEGSNVSWNDGYDVLAEIKDVPAPGQWVDLAISNTKPYRWIRYIGPEGKKSSVAELEFYSGDRKFPIGSIIDGVPFGTASGSEWTGWHKALDGRPQTSFTSDHLFVGFDLKDQAGNPTPKLIPPPANYPEAQQVSVSGGAPGSTFRYTLDGTLPSATNGTLCTGAIDVSKNTTLVVAAFRDGLAPSPAAYGTYLIGPSQPPSLSSFHIGNSLTTITHDFAIYPRSVGYEHTYGMMMMISGSLTKQLWEDDVVKHPDIWQRKLGGFHQLDDFTLQPRDFNIPEEASYDMNFFKAVWDKFPNVQPWLYAEWVEGERQRPTDRGVKPTAEMQKVFPALTWEESMSAMLLYNEDLERTINETSGPAFAGHKKVRILPTDIAFGRMKNMVDHGEIPGLAPGSFFQKVLMDYAHANMDGTYLVCLTWYAAFYGESPEGKVLPLKTDFTAEQATAMQKLAWDVVKNYPDCGFYEEGTSPVVNPQFSPAPEALGDVQQVALTSATPGAWFRYTLDGTTPTRTRGYIYCGVISVRSGMTVKAIAYKSGLADSGVTEGAYPQK